MVDREFARKALEILDQEPRYISKESHQDASRTYEGTWCENEFSDEPFKVSPFLIEVAD